MDRGDPDFLERLFEQASALPPEEQEAFLEDACAGDPEAEAELRSLIAAARGAEGFFDSLADAVVSLSPWARDDRESLSSETEGPDPLIGRSVRQYRIEGLLGRGGMGVVYGAHDTTLDRPVALKFLARHMTADEEAAERFLVEARAAAALDHPNVCTVHEIGESEDGRRFIAMAYCEGETLKQKLARGPLPVEEAKDYARQMAAALEAANKRDIVHRDIKPGNAIVSPEGLVKVLDFGLAKLADVTLTRTGSTMGTVAYMSPEQTRGGKDVDHRTDLWSLGVVLYEMLTGERPFKGDSNAVVIHAIQQEEPEPPSALCPEVDPELEDVVTRLLAKDPAERYQSATDLRHALGEPRTLVQVIGSRWRWVGLGAAAAAAGIAILLFSPFGAVIESDSPLAAEATIRPWTIVAEFEGTADTAILAVARARVAEELSQSTILSALSGDPIQRGLDLAGKPDTTSLTEPIARELAIRHSIRTVVTGQIDRLGSRYSVILRVVDAEDGTTVASVTGEAPEEGLLAELDQAVLTLRRQLGERREALTATRRLVEARTPDFQAYQKYVEAINAYFDRAAEPRSRPLILEAVKYDPGFAAAWLHLTSSFAWLNHAEKYAALDSAIKYRDRLTEAQEWELQAQEAARVGNGLGMQRALKEAIRAQPNDIRLYGRLARRMRRTQPEEALEILARADTISPFGLYQRAHEMRIQILIDLGRLDEARSAIQRLTAEEWRLWYLWSIALAEADWAAADSLDDLVSAWPDWSGFRNGTPGRRVASLAARGRISAAQEIIFQSRALDLKYLSNNMAQWTARRRSPQFGPDAPVPPVPTGSLGMALYLHLASGAPLPTDSTCWDVPGTGVSCWTGALTEAVYEAVAGDSVSVERIFSVYGADTLRNLGGRLVRYSVQDADRVLPRAVGAAVAHREGAWEEVIRHGAEVGLTEVRWLLADAYEKTGRLAEAAQHFEPFAQRGADAIFANQGAARIFYSFAHRRLARIYAQLGDRSRAIRHWETFLNDFTNPDPEYEWMVEEGRAELRRLRS